MKHGPAAVVLGSAFSMGAAPDSALGRLVPETVTTAFGPVRVFRQLDTDGVVLFRHGLPHRYLPHQVPWRAHAAALATLGVRALMLTSSVGVLAESVPLYTPHLAADLVMPDNRLPDGSMCTMWPDPDPLQAHLVVDKGLFHSGLGDWLAETCALPGRRLTFCYVPGPRTKTSAENRLLRSLGIEVNSMSVGPEVVLANELEIPTIALLTGHKVSSTGGPSTVAVSQSLEAAVRVNRVAVQRFLEGAPGLPFENVLYRFPAGGDG